MVVDTSLFFHILRKRATLFLTFPLTFPMSILFLILYFFFFFCACIKRGSRDLTPGPPRDFSSLRTTFIGVNIAIDASIKILLSRVSVQRTERRPEPGKGGEEYVIRPMSWLAKYEAGLGDFPAVHSQLVTSSSCIIPASQLTECVRSEVSG